MAWKMEKKTNSLVDALVSMHQYVGFLESTSLQGGFVVANFWFNSTAIFIR